MAQELFHNALAQAHYILSNLPLEGETVIDATAGRGNDTLFLAKAVGLRGRVFAFDIQEKAISQTKQLLIDNQISWYTLVHDSHANLDHYPISSPIAIIFNLGYLPGGDHDLVTNPETTVVAVQKALKLLKVGGALTIVIYTGHKGAKEEEAALRAYLKTLSRVFDVLEFAFLNRTIDSPYLIAIHKLKEV